MRRFKWLKLARRVHLYAGLVLLPWSMFFGASGLLFNHPNLGEQVSAFRLGPDRVHALTGLAPWDLQAVASELVVKLNAGAGRPAYTLDPEFAVRLNGRVILKAPAPNGQHLLLFNPERAVGIVATRSARPEGDPAPFATTHLELPQYSLPRLEQQLSDLLVKTGTPGPSTLKADPKLAPTLELRAKDDRGQLWNVSYAVGTGEVSGRLRDQLPNLGLSQLLSMLHTTHHFPLGLGVRWFWALFQDLLGVAMVFWGLSGLVMWWQLKVTRVVGAISLLSALGIAGAVAYGTASDLLFGDIAQKLGPGD
ncbi:MAG TPA: PepSY domain-containing protein [Polyangiaceae bacterium]|nr:PepSY domain-containing protein [Polyangiaceae bacterium]